MTSFSEALGALTCNVSQQKSEVYQHSCRSGPLLPHCKLRHLKLKQTPASEDDQGLWFLHSQPDIRGCRRDFACARTHTHTGLGWEKGSNKEFWALEDHHLEAAAETFDNSLGYWALCCLNLSLARAIACHPPKANPLFFLISFLSSLFPLSIWVQSTFNLNFRCTFHDAADVLSATDSICHLFLLKGHCLTL